MWLRRIIINYLNLARQDKARMRKKLNKKPVVLPARSKLLIVLLTFHWWVIPAVSCEEQSILQDADVLD